MTTMINTSSTADFAKLEKFDNVGSRPTCFTTPDIANFPQVPIGAGSPLFKLAVLISQCFVRLFGPALLVPDRAEGEDADYPVFWPCCS